MKITDKAKRKVEKQRLKIIKQHYRAYSFGDSIYNTKFEKYIVLLKKEFDGQYYFIVQNKHGKMLLQKWVYNTNVSMVNISRDGRRYAQNSTVFDSWFKEVEAKMKRHISGYYNRTKLGIHSEKVLGEIYTLVLKREHEEKYYFILKSESGKYLVAKLVWFKDFVTVGLSEEEVNRNRILFAKWMDEAKRQERNNCQED